MEPFNHLPPELERRLEAELKSDERILWTQSPSQERWAHPKLPLRTRWLLLIPAFRAILESVPDRILYVVTNQRAMILHKLSDGQMDVHNISASEMSGRQITVSADASGDLTFPKVPYPTIILPGNRIFPKTQNQDKYKVGFYGVSDVRTVDDLIRHTFGDLADV